MLQLHVEQEFLNCTRFHPTVSHQGGACLHQESWDVRAVLGEQRCRDTSQAGAGLWIAALPLTSGFWAN